MRKALVRHSKFLSYVLRHAPEEHGLTLGPGGWVEVEALLHAARAAGHALSRETLAEVVATNDKQRFAISADGLRIRANQGHSVAVDLLLEAVIPPDVLWHGTATRFLASIEKQGLLRGARRHVHLSADRETATAVGTRHGVPVVLEVRAAEMHAAGLSFYRSDNGVWLTEHVPARFLGRASTDTPR